MDLALSVNPSLDMLAHKHHVFLRVGGISSFQQAHTINLDTSRRN